MYLKKLQQITQNSHKIAIVGLARENRQFIKWLVEVLKFPVAQILLADRLSQDQLSTETTKQIELYDITKNQLFLGENYLDILKTTNVKMVFKSPGIWSLLPEFEAFRKNHGPDSILSGLVFFFEKFREQIIGVTGTKGKSTTCSLIAHLLNQVGQNAQYCGNTINISPYTYWTELNQFSEPDRFFVIEISSFQLQDLGYAQISPKYAVITNYFVDHLDQHNNKLEYWQSKDNLFLFQTPQDFCLVGPTVLQKTSQPNLLTDNILAIDIIDNVKSLLYSALVGEHNWSNLTQAILTVQKASGQELVKNQEIYQEALNTYQPLPHRLQHIRADRIDNLTINFFDDGYATEPDAVAAAVRALSQNEDEYLWLMLTGKDKGVEVENLFLAILEVQQKTQLYRVEYCGSIGQKVLTTFTNTLGLKPPTEIENFRQTIQDSFTSIIQIANKFAQWYSEQQQALHPFKKPDRHKPLTLNVLLSPGGSSFDEFDNQQQRAEWWTQKVLDLK